MKAFLLLVVLVIAVFLIAGSEEKRPWSYYAKKGKFCTQLCNRLKGVKIGPFKVSLKGPCLSKCRAARDRAIQHGKKILVCKNLCSLFKYPYQPICKKACPLIKKAIKY